MTARAPFRAPGGTEFIRFGEGHRLVEVLGSRDVCAPLVADAVAFVLSSEPGSLASIAAEEIGAKPAEGLRCAREKCPKWDLPSGYCSIDRRAVAQFCGPVLSRLLALGRAWHRGTRGR